MSCSSPTDNRAKDPMRAKCKSAVMCAYKCLMSDEPHCVAMDAARRVYQYHNPADDKTCAALVVEQWVAQETDQIQ